MSDESLRPMVAWDGRPESPEKDGWHWVTDKNGELASAMWLREGEDAAGEFAGTWTNLRWGSPLLVAQEGYTYFGPALAPAAAATLRAERDAALARVAVLEEALRGWEECAQYDAMMEGPRFKGWDRSALDRMRRLAEARRAALGDAT